MAPVNSMIRTGKKYPLPKHRKGVKFAANDNISGVVHDGSLSTMRCRVEARMQDVLEALMIDTENDHNTRDTAHRIAKMFMDEIFVGRYTPKPKMTFFPNVKKLDEMLVHGPIDVKSVCSHHFQPFIGHAWIGVLPASRVVGLSKFNRLVDWYARRPQIQEELTVQIADDIQELMKPKGLIVVIKAKHFCIHCRGPNQDSMTATSVARGALRNNASSKAEFLSLINLTR